MKRMMILFVMVFSGLNLMGQGVIADRAMLNGILGSQRADEGFESIGLTDGQGQGGDAVLSATNLWGGWPNPLVISGITFESPFSIHWNGNNSGGSITKEISGMEQLSVDFWNPTWAFGIDLKDYATFPRALIAGVTVYGADDLTVLYTDNNIVMTNGNPAAGVFFGFQDPNGIGKVLFTTIVPGVQTGWSPQIDNLSFSTAPIPEPSTVAIALLGLSALAYRFRKM